MATFNLTGAIMINLDDTSHLTVDIDEDDEMLPPTSIQENQIHASHQVQQHEVGQRLDKLVATLWSQYSRSQLQDWITKGQLTVNHQSAKPNHRVKCEDKIELNTILQQHSEDLPENIDIDIIYEDDDVLVINKPVGMVVHPGAGNWTGTLVNALLYHYPKQSHLPRAGLVHRIDKDTSGLLIIGKNHLAQQHLINQLKDKSVYRHYQCIVTGSANDLKKHRTIDAPIGRHKTQRIKMAVTSHGKPAVTHIIEATPLNEHYCLLDVALETGRTHQIRVHLSHIGYPLVGDAVYGNRKQLRAGLTETQRQAIIDFPRQALHAYALGFIHPATNKPIELTSPLPHDINELINILQHDTHP